MNKRVCIVGGQERSRIDKLLGAKIWFAGVQLNDDKELWVFENPIDPTAFNNRAQAIIAAAEYSSELESYDSRLSNISRNFIVNLKCPFSTDCPGYVLVEITSAANVFFGNGNQDHTTWIFENLQDAQEQMSVSDEGGYYPRYLIPLIAI